MKKWKTIISAFALALCASVTAVGFGGWVIQNDSDIRYDKYYDSNVKKVAYIRNGNANAYYTSIERALEAAKNDATNNTIYVIPGTNPVITKNCEIAKGDTLCLPYEDDGNDTHVYLNRNDTTTGATFGDVNAERVKTNKKNQVTINESITLTNNGTLTIGGSIGYGAGAVGLTGQTASSYCEILMNPKSGIINNGNLNLYGYIKESSAKNGSYIEHKNSSIMKMPFVIYDFRGGSYSYACYKEEVMPFSNYDFPNCQPLQKFAYGSKMYGLATIYAGDTWSTPEVLVLGTNSDSCLFKLSNNYATIKYTPSNVLYTTNDVTASTTAETANLTEIRTYGDISLASLKIGLNVGIKITVDTSKMFCPLCFKYQVFVERGTFTISNKMKFWGGSSLIVKAGANLTCNANVSFYQDYIPNITTGGRNLYPSSFTSASLVMNGTINLNSAFGGLVETSESSGRLNTTNNFINSVSSSEVLTSTGKSIFASADKTETKVQDALGYFGATEKPVEPNLISKAESFESKGDYWYLPLTDITSVAISPESGASAKNTIGIFELTALISPIENSCSNITYQWTCDSGASLSSTTGEKTTLTIPANDSRWSDKSYNVSCLVTFTASNGSSSSLKATGIYTATKRGW